MTPLGRHYHIPPTVTDPVRERVPRAGIPVAIDVEMERENDNNERRGFLLFGFGSHRLCQGRLVVCRRVFLNCLATLSVVFGAFSAR
ncbi:unnamed protein product [Macrosiphum euphorbiae]|uniref:Cytochrome P450 n=1 Tax=Macrosiphum euphorbiae TaxID=13131 RepID=A0AAV0WYX4_9HEMI|nr:unnamed protein product [Macrosiphum euphorbiae]